MMKITKDLLHELFNYVDGQLYWKVTRNNYAKTGDIAGYLEPSGYWKVMLEGKNYRTHRLVYLMHYGTLPALIDHINGKKDDNRIENLRAATKAQNQQNSKISRSNTSGVKGVCWDKRANKWLATLCIDGKNKYVGLFGDLELAKTAIQQKRNEHHKEFARHD